MAKVNAFKAIIKMTEQEYSYKHSKEKKHSVNFSNNSSYHTCTRAKPPHNKSQTHYNSANDRRPEICWINVQHAIINPSQIAEQQQSGHGSNSCCKKHT
jgi:hypothetical protein